MGLLDLPTEIISQIIRDTRPDGYEAFMLACKAIHNTGQEFLERHNAFQLRYKRFRYSREISCSLQLLHCIGKDPIIADYIKTGDFFGDPSPEELSQSGFEEWDTLLNDRSTGKTISQTLENLQLPSNPQFASQTRLDVVAISQLAVLHTIVILSLLPNLEELILPKQWAQFPPSIGNTDADEFNVLWRALEAIVRNANAKHAQSRPLGKLSRIFLLHPVHHAAALGVQHHLSAFLPLASLREASVSNCLANRAYLIGRPFTWRYFPQVSNLEKIELASSCVDAEIANLLMNTPRLRSFRLSYASKSFGCGTHWDVNAVFRALRNHCAETLTELSITIDRVGTVKGGLRSLKDFKKLQHLELDVCVFFGPEVTEELLNMPPLDYRNYAYDVRWNGTAVPCLANILPGSIHSVRLITGSCREDILIVKSLFAHLDDCVTDDLPSLKTLTVSRALSMIGNQPVAMGQPATGWESVCEMVRSAGFHFEEEEVVKAHWLD